MTSRTLRALGSMFLVATLFAACSATPGAPSTAPASEAPTTATVPVGFPIGSWTTTITEADLRAGGVTGEGELGENAGDITLVMSEDGTWSTTQVSELPLRWPVFQGTWTPKGPDGFTQTTTFPADFAGDVVDFTWKVEDGGLILKVVNPPDPILPILMESHPWQPAG
jgi:hypothetical protein